MTLDSSQPRISDGEDMLHFHTCPFRVLDFSASHPQEPVSVAQARQLYPLGKSASVHCRPRMSVLSLWPHSRCISEHLLRAPGVCFHSRPAAGVHWDIRRWVWAGIFWCQNINPSWGVITNSVTRKGKSTTASGLETLVSSCDTCLLGLCVSQPVTFPKCGLLRLSGQRLNKAADGAVRFASQGTDTE